MRQSLVVRGNPGGAAPRPASSPLPFPCCRRCCCCCCRCRWVSPLPLRTAGAPPAAARAPPHPGTKSCSASCRPPCACLRWRGRRWQAAAELGGDTGSAGTAAHMACRRGQSVAHRRGQQRRGVQGMRARQHSHSSQPTRWAEGQHIPRQAHTQQHPPAPHSSVPPAFTVARPLGPRMWNCSCTCSRPSLSLYTLRAGQQAAGAE